MPVVKLQLAQEPAADALLEANPFALLVGMLLDQQVPIRWKNVAQDTSRHCWSKNLHLQ